MSFATSSDLQTFLNRTLTAGELAQATLLLGFASDAIRSELRQTIDLVTDDEVVLRGNYSSVLTLPERPVVDVTSVEIDDEAVTNYTWDGAQCLYLGTWDNRTGVWAPVYPASELHWGGPQAQVTVVNSHGFATIPDIIKGICLSMVARTLPNPGGAMTSETLGPYSVTYGAQSIAGSVACNPAERRILRKKFGR